MNQKPRGECISQSQWMVFIQTLISKYLTQKSLLNLQAHGVVHRGIPATDGTLRFWQNQKVRSTIRYRVVFGLRPREWKRPLLLSSSDCKTHSRGIPSSFHLLSFPESILKPFLKIIQNVPISQDVSSGFYEKSTTWRWLTIYSQLYFCGLNLSTIYSFSLFFISKILDLLMNIINFFINKFTLI